MKIDLVDVFANGTLSGNPLAVVHGGAELGTARMQKLAAWIGFSETSFLLPPTVSDADYHVRIFTPTTELPFAGHPTLGAAFAWCAAHGLPAHNRVIVQECGVGLVPVRIAGARLAFRAPPLIRQGALTSDELAEALAILQLDSGAVIDAVHVDNGPPWKLIRLASAEAVLAVQTVARAEVGVDIGVIGPSDAAGIDWEVRAFFSKQGGALVEDPVTGSFNAGVAQYLFGERLVSGDYVAAQGRCVGADGRVYVSRDEHGIWIGGDVRMVAAGAVLTG